jgi:hypothetical protein
MSRSFPGAANTDNITVGQQPPINNLAPFSFACWFFATALDTVSRRFYNKVDATGAAGTNHSEFHVRSDTGIGFAAYLWNTTAGLWNAATVPSINVWHHIAITYLYSATTDAPIIYLDGVSQTVVQQTAPVGTLGTETIDFVIGNGNGAGGSLNRCFTGYIGEPAL